MTEPSVAVYWDFENVHNSAMTMVYGPDWFKRIKEKKLKSEDTKVLDIAAIMNYANTLGEVVINRAYANWTFFYPYADLLNTYSMDMVQLFPIGMNAKNGADIRLSLDIAEDLVLHPHLDIVLLISGDSDFISIAQRVRRRHKRIIGLGVKETSNRYWQMACNEFKLYRTIVAQYGLNAQREEEEDAAYMLNEQSNGAIVNEAPKEVATPTESEDKTKKVGRASAKTSKTLKTTKTTRGKAAAAKAAEQEAEQEEKKKEAEASALAPSTQAPAKSEDPRNLPQEKRLLRRAINALESREGSSWISRVKIKPMMLRLDPAFDEANLGYTNFTSFLEGNADVIEHRMNGDEMLIKVKKPVRGKASPRTKS